MGLGFLSRRVDVAAAASAAGVGVEEAGREARYAFFCEVSRSHQGAPLVLAHHADDQVETFCFRLLRGAGTSGLGGMAPFSFREDGRVRVLRPLLSVWRWEIDAMVQDRGLAYREDPSNRDSRWTRNRIRHELLPEMERVMQRPVREAIWRAAEILRAEAEWMDTCEGGETVLGEVLDVDALGKMPLALRRRRVARWLRRQGCQGIGFSEVEAVLGLLVRLRPAKVNLSAGCFVRRRQGQIFVEKPGSQRDCD
ncbi:MAG: tRNA(Ile)-lysidine synthase [Verrucomicrobiota bacterium]|jgi:tRNA(Ile)-lysidine synthase